MKSIVKKGKVKVLSFLCACYSKNFMFVLELSLVSILIDINEDWITGNRYIVMEQYSKKKNRGIE